MERKPSDVKRRGRYVSTRRQAQARATREAILEVARRRFLANGFTTTTVASLASDAGVSVDTIYKAFGGKPGLVRALYERALAGEGPVHAEARSDALQQLERDPLTITREFGNLIKEIAPRTAPIMLLIRDAAASDPEMGKLQAELDEQRLRRMIRNAENLRNAGHLRAELSIEAAGEIGWLYTAPQLYELLVINRGWPIERFGAFVGDALAAAYLPPEVVARGAPQSKRKPKR